MNTRNKILVIGDVMLDHYIYGSCNRISPEAPVQVVDFEVEKWLLGGAANVANNLVELGVDVVLCGVVGDDASGQILNVLLDQRGITNLLIISEKRKTTLKSRIISNGHQLLRIDNEVKVEISDEEADNVYRTIEADIANYSVLVLSDYAKGVLTDGLTIRIIKLANKLGIPTIVDPKKPPYSKFFGSTIIKPNRKEAFEATGINISHRANLSNVCAKIQNMTGSKAVVVTLSEEGVAVYFNNNLALLPTRAKEVYDVTGAGDTFLAALAFKILNQVDIFDACEFANFASGVAVGKQGCATVKIEEIIYLIENFKNDKFETC